MPRYLDMETLGFIEAARAFFLNEGWAGSTQTGHWAIRFDTTHVLVLDLVSDQGDTLKAMSSGLQRVPCYSFGAAQILPEPGIAEPVELYDLAEAVPLSVHDWSDDADYIANVVRALLGENDQRLEELITWLELHRDERSGHVSATGADPQKAFEAIRSGELATRLSTDKAVMAAYLSAVRNDPAVARAATEAAAQVSVRDREVVIATLRSELAADHEKEKKRQEKELKERELALQAELEQRIKVRGSTLERELQGSIAAAGREAEEQSAARIKALAAEKAELTSDRDTLLAEQGELRAEAARLSSNIAVLIEKCRLAEEEVSRQLSISSAIAPQSETPSRTLIRLPDIDDVCKAQLSIERVALEISRSAMLTTRGKALMERFVIFMLAGEIPILEGEQADAFALIAEGLIAAHRLLPIDLDATILTPEDIWSRPGSGIESPVAQASNRARAGDGTFLVQLRGIERSAARYWYPALAVLARRGLLPRRLLLFATVMGSQ